MAYADIYIGESYVLGKAFEWVVSPHYYGYRFTLVASTDDGKHSVTIANGTTQHGYYTIPKSWANSNTTGESVKIKFTATVYDGNKAMGASDYIYKIFTIPDDVVPTCSLTVSDATGLVDTFGAYIRNKSRVSGRVNASGVYGSTIVRYRTEFNGLVYSNANFTSNPITSYGSLNLYVTVTDSRGRKATFLESITVLDYAPPSISKFAVSRCADASGSGTSGNYLKVSFNSSVFALGNKNTANYQIKYKKTTDDEYTTVTLTEYANQYSVSNGVYVFAADPSSSYNVTLIITDAVGNGTKTVIGKTASKLWSIFGKGLGFAVGKIAELAGVFDIEFQTRFNGGILQPVLENNTDLDDVKIPNTYTGKNANSAGYKNCPVTSMTFKLTVESCGGEGQVRQIFTTCSKDASKTFERFYYQNAWGEWICTSDMGGKLLWSGAYFMNSGQTITLAEEISKQPHGVVFCWSAYNFNDGAVNGDFKYFFVPKYHITAFEGKAIVMSDIYLGMHKTLYVSDLQITGYLENEGSGTEMVSQMPYENSRMALRAVIGL